MWDYTDRQDPTQISSDELKKTEIDDGVRAITKLKKKSIVPKVFGTAVFSKLNPRTEVW
jgi:tRNA A37 threonylcarbamoyladenosine dehydratase